MNNQVLIHCKESYFNRFLNTDFNYQWNCDEVDVIVDNIPNLNDEELCTHYGIDYEKVNCIEVA